MNRHSIIHFIFAAVTLLLLQFAPNVKVHVSIKIAVRREIGLFAVN